MVFVVLSLGNNFITSIVDAFDEDNDDLVVASLCDYGEYMLMLMKVLFKFSQM